MTSLDTPCVHLCALTMFARGGFVQGCLVVLHAGRPFDVGGLSRDREDECGRSGTKKSTECEGGGNSSTLLMVGHARCERGDEKEEERWEDPQIGRFGRREAKDGSR